MSLLKSLTLAGEFVPEMVSFTYIGKFRDRIDKVTDEVNLGDKFDVKYFGIDPKTWKTKVSKKLFFLDQIEKNFKNY